MGQKVTHTSWDSKSRCNMPYDLTSVLREWDTSPLIIWDTDSGGIENVS